MYGTQINTSPVFSHVVDYVVDCLKPVEFDTIVFRGFSGALVGPTVALQMEKQWALVRKPGDNAHSNNSIEGFVKGKFVILDDFIVTGTTIRAIVEAVSHQPPFSFRLNESEELVPNKIESPKCAGVILYERVWCENRADKSKYWEELLGGLRILNWPAAEIVSRKRKKSK